MTQSNNAVSALELMGQFGVSYKTACRMKHKLLQTILLREQLRRLDGRVKIDDSIREIRKQVKPARASQNKAVFVRDVQTSPNGKPPLSLLRISGVVPN